MDVLHPYPEQEKIRLRGLVVKFKVCRVSKYHIAEIVDHFHKFNAIVLRVLIIREQGIFKVFIVVEVVIAGHEFNNQSAHSVFLPAYRAINLSVPPTDIFYHMA